MTPKPITYASIIRRKMSEKRLTRRDLEKATGYSYEHIRKVVNGMPLMSEAFNTELCKALSLDPDEMWEIAKREKAKTSHIAMPDIRLQEFWNYLMPSDQEQVIAYAQSLATQRRIAMEQQAKPEPEVNFENMTVQQMRESMNRLMEAMTRRMEEDENGHFEGRRGSARR